MPISAPGADETLRILAMLDARGQGAARAVAVTTTSTHALGSATAKAHLSTGRLSQELLTMTKNMLGVNPAVAQISGALGKMAIGDTAMIGILAGLAAVGFAYEMITKKTREAAEEQAKFQKALGESANAGELGKLREQARQLLYGTPYDEKGKLRGSSSRVKGAFVGSIADLQAELAELEKQIPRDAAMAPAAIADRYNAITKQLDVLIPKFNALKEAANNVASQPAGNAGLLGTVTSTAKAPHTPTEKELNAFHEEVVAAQLEEQNERNRIAREGYERQVAETLEILEEGWRKEKELREEHDRDVLAGAKAIATSLGDVIRSTMAGALQGGISGGLGSLKDAALSALGETLIGIGMTMIAAAPWLKAASAALLTLSGGGSLLAGAGLVALGATLVSAGSGSHGGGGAAGGYSSSIGSTMASNLVSVGPAAAPNMAGVKATQPVTVNAWLIGKTDLTAARDLVEMIDFARSKRM